MISERKKDCSSKLKFRVLCCRNGIFFFFFPLFLIVLLLQTENGGVVWVWEILREIQPLLLEVRSSFL